VGGASGVYFVDAENPWLTAARAARLRPPAWLLLGLGAAVAAAASLLLPGLAEAVLQAAAGASHPSSAGDLIEEAVVDVLVFGVLLGVAAAGSRVEGRPILAASPQTPLSIGLGLACGLVGIGAALGLASLAGVVGSAAQTGGAAASAGAAAGLALVALQSGAEEVYFRGWIQPVVCARWGAWPGLLVTAALFAVLHLINATASPLAVANMFLGGVLFGLLALRTGGLWAPFLAHWSWNWLERTLGLGSGGSDAGPSLGGLRLVGSSLWTGGDDGLTGGLDATFALVVVILAVLAAAPSPSGQPAARRSGSAP